MNVNKNFVTLSVKRLSLFFVILFLSSKVMSDNSFYYEKDDRSVYIYAGMANVKANELVYCQPGGGCPVDYKLSQLIWESKNAAILTLGLKNSFSKNSYFNVEAKVLADKGKGVMDDYDWQYINLDWSDWSHHEDTELKKSTVLDISLNLNFYSHEKTNMYFLAGYRESNWGWESRGGTYIYSTVPTLYRDQTGSFTQGLRVISYEQEFSMPYLGLKYEVELGKWLFDFQYNYSNKVNASSIDHHYLRSLIFKDDFKKSVMNAYKIGIGYKFNKKYRMDIRYEARNFEEARGNTTYINSNTGAIIGDCVNCAGIDNLNQSLSIGVSANF